MRALTRTEILTEEQKPESALMDVYCYPLKEKKKKGKKLRDNLSFATTRGRTREPNIKS